MGMSWTVYVIKTSDNSYFAGSFNHFVEPRFETRITGARLFEDKGVAEMVLDRVKNVTKEGELSAHFPNPKIHQVVITLLDK